MALTRRGAIRLVAALGAAAGLILMGPAAHADMIDLDVSGGASLGNPPYGTVTLTQNGTSVDVTVHLNDPNAFLTSGAGDGQVLGFNANGVVAGDITVDSHTPALTAGAGPFHMDGLGDFGFGIECPTCGNGAGGRFAADIVFHVASASISDFVVNADGMIFGADIISCNEAQCGSGSGTGDTGVVGADPPSAVVPEPGALALVGAGLAGLGLSSRRWWFSGGKR